MQRSTERFLTTHTGSLPRPDDLDPHDVRQGGRRAGRRAPRSPRASRAAVAEVVRKQAEAGIDIVNDGEMTQAELRHLHQGPADRLRRHRQHASSTRTSSTSPSSRSACSAIPAARGARRRPATRRSACATREAARDRRRRI